MRDKSVKCFEKSTGNFSGIVFSDRFCCIRFFSLPFVSDIAHSGGMIVINISAKYSLTRKKNFYDARGVTGLKSFKIIIKWLCWFVLFINVLLIRSSCNDSDGGIQCL